MFLNKIMWKVEVFLLMQSLNKHKTNMYQMLLSHLRLVFTQIEPEP